jgi:AraC-like DNA-binding protein
MVNPVERLTAEWRFAPAAALSDLPYTGMAVMRWTCRTALEREFVSRVGDDVHVFSYVLRNSRATSWLDGRQVRDGLRIERARQRLLFGREPVLAIALDCGFKDAGHFARAFACETGLSPRRFRQAA